MFLLFFIILTNGYNYNNGARKSPVLGWSTWLPYESALSEDGIKNNTLELINRGFVDAGYIYINVDEGWILNRSANGTLISDPNKIPSGMYNLGEWIHSKNLKYGLYSSRGTVQCGDYGNHYVAPGSYGFYTNDSQYVADMKADYFKFDSCGGVGGVSDAFDQYTEFGQLLNATGRPIYYDLCAWHWYYALIGVNVSNSWRIDGDDNNFGAIETAFYLAYSGMQKYASPYTWNNMDFLFSGNTNNTYPIGHQTQLQARAQFSIYALASSDLIISDFIAYLTDYDVETYTNKILLNANQDIGPDNGPHAGYKLWGLTPVNNISIFGKKLSDGTFIAAFLNTLGSNEKYDITCNSDCSVQMLFNNSVKKVSVYDVWNKQDLGTLELTNILNQYKTYTGTLEMGMCTGSIDQQFIYYNETGIIKSVLNNNTLGLLDCNANKTYPLITLYNYDINPLCNGDEETWIVKLIENGPSYCQGYQCYSICNKLYSNDNKNGDTCLYYDTIRNNGSYWGFFKDGTIRDMNGCNNGAEFSDGCRCLQHRPYIGSNAWNSFTVKDIVPQGGVNVIQFTPV